MAVKPYWPRSVYRLGMILFIFFKIHGLATFTINRRETSKKKCAEIVSFTGTKLGVLYNLSLSCTIISLNYVTLPMLCQAEYTYQSDLTTVIEIIQGILGTLVVTSTLWHYCINRTLSIKNINYFFIVENTLRRLKLALNWSNIFRILLPIYMILFPLFVGVLVTEHISFDVNPILWTTNILPTTFIGLVFIQYFSVLTLTGAIFSRVNHFMKDLSEHFTGKLYPNSIFGTRQIFVSCSPSKFLIQIRDIHDRVCNVCEDVAEFYSWPSLAGISFVFFTLLYNVYYLFGALIINNVTLETIVVVNSLLWIIFLLYPLGLLTNKVTNIIKEIEETGNIVHALLNRTIDRETKSELKQFSLQLLHRRIKFTAHGYFSLDNTAFQSMLSTVTTYMVILIQFQMGSSRENVNTCNCTE